MPQFLPIFILPFVILVVILSIRNKQPLECLPSLFWTLSSVLPYLYLRQYFPSAAADTQAIGISSVLVALLIADIFANIIMYRRTGHVETANRNYINGKFMMATLFALAAYVIIIPLIHIATAKHIPLLTRLLLSTPVGQQLSDEREHFSKLLEIPALLKFMFNWVLVIVAPILIVFLLGLRHWIWAFLAFTWAVVYSLLSLAVFPIVILCYSTTVGAVGLQSARKQKTFVILLIVFGAICFVAGAMRGEAFTAWFDTLDKGTIPLAQSERIKANDSVLTPGDIDRIQIIGTPLVAPPTFGRHIDSLVRRSVLVPMEVSNRWYAYFPKVSGGYRTIADLIPSHRDEGWVHPANAVARWGYTRLFPEHYTDTTAAYASIDADAYAHGGIGIIVVVSVLIAIFRVLLTWLRGPDIVSTSIYTCAVAAISILLFQASIQAILIAQGIALSFFALVGWRIIRRWT